MLWTLAVLPPILIMAVCESDDWRCRVIAWEPVPHFRAFMEYGLALNGLGTLVHVRPFVAASAPGETYKLVVPQRGIWGTASVNGGNIDKWVLLPLKSVTGQCPSCPLTT